MEVRVPERQASVIVSSGGAPLMPFWDSAYNLVDVTRSEIVVEQRNYEDGIFSSVWSHRFLTSGRSFAA